MNITTKEQIVLETLLTRSGGIYSKELISYCKGISKSEISGVISSLVKKGLVDKDTFGPGEDFIEMSEKCGFSYTQMSVSGPKEAPTFYLKP